MTIYAPYSSSIPRFPSFRGLPPSQSRITSFGASEAPIHSLCSWGERPGKVVPADGQASDLPLGSTVQGTLREPLPSCLKWRAGDVASFEAIPFQSGPTGSALNSPAWRWGCSRHWNGTRRESKAPLSSRACRTPGSSILVRREDAHLALPRVLRVQSTWLAHCGNVRPKSGEMNEKESFSRGG